MSSVTLCVNYARFSRYIVFHLAKSNTTLSYHQRVCDRLLGRDGFEPVGSPVTHPDVEVVAVFFRLVGQSDRLLQTLVWSVEKRSI